MEFLLCRAGHVIAHCVADVQYSTDCCRPDNAGCPTEHLSLAVLGIKVFQTRLVAMFLGGFMIGIAGGLYNFYLGFIDQDFFKYLIGADTT